MDAIVGTIPERKDDDRRLYSAEVDELLSCGDKSVNDNIHRNDNSIYSNNIRDNINNDIDNNSSNNNNNDVYNREYIDETEIDNHYGGEDGFYFG